VQQKLERYLARLQRQRDLPDQLVDFRQHLVDRLARWGDDLLRYHDIVGLSPTNNALRCASRFGCLRRDQRRITGRQLNTATLLDEGPYLVWKCGETEIHVLARLRRVPPITLIISRAIRSCGKSETIASWPIAYNISCLELCTN
jgi:hypothetical protein